METRIPTEVEIVFLDDWTFYRDLDSQECTALQLETTWGPGWWEVIIRLAGFGIRMTAERSNR